MYHLPGFCFKSVILIVLALPITVSAQHGTVRYSHTRPVLALPGDQMDVLVSGPEAVDPTHVTISRILFFDAHSSLMYPSDNGPYVPGERTADGKDIGWEFIDSTFVRYDELLFVESRKFDEGLFLVEDALPSWSWKIAPGIERNYLGYRVMKATSTTELGDIEAWFTPEIPVSAGPGLFHGLPGLILMVTNTEIGEVYSAEEIDLVAQPNSTGPPVSGKQVMPDQYIQIIEQTVAEDQHMWEVARDAIINATPVKVRGNW